MGTLRKSLVFAPVLVAFLAPPLHADDGSAAAVPQRLSSVAFPGSFWISAGHVGPAEPDNAMADSAFEQGITAWSRDAWFLVPYVAARFSTDVDGHAWNNRRPTTFGVKVVRRVPNGVVQGGGGVMVDRDAGSGRSGHLTAFVSYWAGWTGDRQLHTAGYGARWPGSVNAMSGLLTAQDPDNWMTAASVQQGVVVHRFSGFSTVPYLGAAGSVDSKRRTWENRLSYDAGVKVVRPIVGGVVEAGVAHRHQRYVLTDAAGSSPVVFVNLWIGWNPRAVIGK